MKKLNIFLTEEQYQKLEKEKEKTGCSKGSIIRIAIDEYFSRREARA